MGCTSSSPNMANSNTAEKSIHFEDEMSDDQSKDSEEIIYRAGYDTNEITVLPSCDTLAEPLHIVRNRSTSSLNTEQENQEDRQFSENTNKTDTSSILQKEEKVAKLGEMVKKVVEFHSPERLDEQESDLKKIEDSRACLKHPYSSNTEGSNVDNNEAHCAVQQDKEKEDHIEEAVSPSQSESSRATRWEAFADIAAELPPSLTVDPITGQIYALFK